MHRFIPPFLVAALACAPAVLCAQTAPAPAAEAADDTVRLPDLVVEAEAESDHIVQGPFLPDAQGPRVNAGKKTTILDFDALPRINANNYRQALAQAPGLILSEETSPLISIGYRGLEPHRAQFTQVLKDGIPIHADQFGYPEAYYTPPLDTVDRIEFTRGGAALMYGPQPGGALNYVTHRPRDDRAFSGSTLHTFGSEDYYSTFTYVDGTVNRLGYYAYYNHRESDGIRDANSDYELDAWLGRLVLDGTSSSRWILTLETYEEEHGEPGGLTAANFALDRRAPTRLFDRFNLSRDAASLAWEHDYDRGTFTVRAWGSDYVRGSRRQGGGGFGTLPTGAAANTNTIERQVFHTWGVEARGRYDWGAEGRHVLSAGAQVYHTDSPRTDARGAAPNATTGVIQTQSHREILSTPVFVENMFRFGAFSVTPGLRFESIQQDVREIINVAKTNSGRPLAARDDRQTVVLPGLAAAWDVAERSQVYANFSESYRPMIYTQAVPNGATTVVNDDLAEGRNWQYELGFRTNAIAGLVLDASVFQMEFDNQIGTIAVPGGLSSVGNVGSSRHRGLEAGAQYDVLPHFGVRDGSALNVYANVLLLDAEFTEGPNTGRTPQYAPDHVIRAGVVYTRGANLKVGLTGTISGDSFADDSNNAQRYVPSYAVWDLTAEWRVSNLPLRVIAGINNIFDEDYYSRVRADGIDPAPRRNYYLGAAFEF